jgi:hypothetical protein
MSNESRGELAEAIAIVAFRRAFKKLAGSPQVHWEETPDSAVVIPDITIGPDPAEPTHVVLVTACDTPRSSAMKYWRNIGEIFDAKGRLARRPRIISLIFRSAIKEELVRLEESLCDAAHLVDRDKTHGAPISAWLEKNLARAPSKKTGKLELVQDALDPASRFYDRGFANAVTSLGLTVAALLKSHKKELEPLWDLVREDFVRLGPLAGREERETLFRRGLARWMVLDDSVRNEFFEAHARRRSIEPSRVPPYAVDLKLVTKAIGGYRLSASSGGQDMLDSAGDDLRKGADFFLLASGNDPVKARAGFKAAIDEAPPFMRNVASQIRNLPSIVKSWHGFVIDHWTHITRPIELYRLLGECFDDEALGGQVSSAGLGRVWIYDHCIAMLRAATGRNNDFGYGPLGARFQRDAESPEFKRFLSTVMSRLSAPLARRAERWVETTLVDSSEPGRRGFQDWLTKEKTVNPIIVASYAYALANLLKECIPKPGSLGIDAVIASHAYAAWNKLLTYPDYEGLPGLVIAACGDMVRSEVSPTLMAEIAGDTVQDAGQMRLLRFSSGGIFWVSATGSHTNDKRKELCGKAMALRYACTLKSGIPRFSRRPGIDQLVLVVDGTWKASDLRILMESGWDKVLYPDELHGLPALILSARPGGKH